MGEVTTTRRVDVALRDGSTLCVRPVEPGDQHALAEFLAGLSDQARYLRFFTGGVDVEREARAATAIGPDAGGGLLALAGRPERVVGHAEYLNEGRGRAEVAFEVAGDWQRHGIATLLLAQLAEAATRSGIHTFTATVLPANHRMIGVFRDSGFAVEVSVQQGEMQIEMPTELTAAGHARFEDRRRAAAAAAVAHVLRPASVAIVGASGTVGAAVVSNLIGAGFTGPVAAVDPRAGDLHGMPVQRSIGEVPWPVELAVLAVPSDAVLDVARQCGEAGVRALVVLTAGFAETGPAGHRRQDELLAVCRGFGMRVVGPNCLGVLNTDDGVRLNATFAPRHPPGGRVAFASQSGAYGIAAIAEAARRGLGLSSFVSTGNKADLSGNDLLQYWEQDPATDLVVLHLESFGNPRRFGQIARRVAASKPIVAVKSGRSAAATPAASSHTGTLVAASDAAVDALFAHAGVIRADTMAESFDVAALLAGQPVPRGGRVAIVTNAGGPAVACADACAAAGLAVGDPTDLGASATADDYRRALEIVAADDGADAIITIFVPPVVTEQADVAAAVRAVARTTAATGKLLVAVFMAQSGAATTPGAGVPAFGTPEEAARALGHAVRYGRWRATADEGPPTLTGLDTDAGAALVARLLHAGTEWLDPGDVDALLGCYGIRRPPVPAAGHAPGGFLVQAMVPEGVEMLAGVVSDPDFGPVVACAAGGRAVELLGDVAVRLAPLTRRDASEMVRSLRTFRLLDGYRGAAACDVAALEDVLLRLSALAAARPEIAELDCDPVVVSPHGAVVVDARIRIAEPPSPRPYAALDR